MRRLTFIDVRGSERITDHRGNISLSPGRAWDIIYLKLTPERCQLKQHFTEIFQGLVLFVVSGGNSGHSLVPPFSAAVKMNTNFLNGVVKWRLYIFWFNLCSLGDGFYGNTHRHTHTVSVNTDGGSDGRKWLTLMTQSALFRGEGHVNLTRFCHVLFTVT